MSAFDPEYGQLPEILPVFPLTGALLLPRGMLPLNIFEPRYLNMVEDALGGARMIGMIQPGGVPPGTAGAGEDDEPPLYGIGCAGRIVSFEETEDGRFLITLKGVARFRVTEEIAGARGYRRVRPGWQAFADDLQAPPEGTVDRERLFDNLKRYFEAQQIEASWEALRETPDERLVNSLSMICPFEASEKQALLESPTLAERAEVLAALVEMAVRDNSSGDKAPQ